MKASKFLFWLNKSLYQSLKRNYPQNSLYYLSSLSIFRLTSGLVGGVIAEPRQVRKEAAVSDYSAR